MIGAAPTRASRVPKTKSGWLNRGWVARAAIGVVLLPFVISAIALVVDVGTNYFPGSDTALTELQTSDIGRHPVLVGLYSRDGWYHPGPALFYALVLPYRLAGSNSIGLSLGALLINGVAIAGIAIVARRRGGIPLMLLTLMGCTVLVRALGPDFVRDPWNPYIPVLPFGLLVFLTWEMTCGEAWALPVGVGVASFCVQTHVGFAPIAIPLLVWGGIWLVLTRRRGEHEDQPRQSRDLVRAALVADVVLVVMWLPAVIQQLFDSPGNLTDVVKYFTESNGPTHSLGEGYRVVAGQFGWSPQWVTGHLDTIPFTGEPRLMYSAPLPAFLVPFAIAAFAFWRWRCSDANRLVAILVLALVLGVVSVTRITGYAYIYRFRWTWFLAMLASVVVLWAGWMLIARYVQPAEARRLVLVVPILALVMLSGINAVSAARAGTPQARISTAIEALGPAVEDALPAGHREVIVRNRSFDSQDYHSALVLYLERHGAAARVDAPGGSFGEHRVRGYDAPPRALLTVAAQKDFDELSTRPNELLIAYWGTKSRQSRARVVARIKELEAEHQAGTISDKAYFDRVSQLQTGRAVGVFMESSVP
jgi:hypothetical protein